MLSYGEKYRVTTHIRAITQHQDLQQPTTSGSCPIRSYLHSSSKMASRIEMFADNTDTNAPEEDSRNEFLPLGLTESALPADKLRE
ncbi:hypothetical protein RvY_15603 [Ramazzottius varieornatus]|uniref:Uncharacterized protein n=1 Tax=Ramazzottius varieornatus TaxID=947166 RepID=A0A1D1W2A0_RAMVA|nr:hypothetical protein RvY_15603 [Ramazzottius varieornatus]